MSKTLRVGERPPVIEAGKHLPTQPADAGRLLFSRYEILSKRSGPNSTLYEAWDNQENRKVAIKEVGAEHVRGNGFKKLDIVEREFRIGSRLEHENLTAYYEAKEDGTSFFLVREWAEGKSLRDLFNQGARFSDEQIKTIISGVLDAVVYLHSLNPSIVHRDIKPDNIIVKLNGNNIESVKLVDLTAPEPKPDSAVTGITTHLFSAGFSAIESIFAPCTQSDLFSVAATILFLKTGRDADSIYDSSAAKYNVPHEAGLFQGVISKGLQVAVSERAQTAKEMKELLIANERALQIHVRTYNALVEFNKKALQLERIDENIKKLEPRSRRCRNELAMLAIGSAICWGSYLGGSYESLNLLFGFGLFTPLFVKIAACGGTGLSLIKSIEMLWASRKLKKLKSDRAQLGSAASGTKQLGAPKFNENIIPSRADPPTRTEFDVVPLSKELVEIKFKNKDS